MTTELHNATLEWAAEWIEGSLAGESNERVREFGRNMAMTLRAARVADLSPVSQLPIAENDVRNRQHCEDEVFRLQQELDALRAETLKGICVYCGEIQQYESLEQKSGEEGNRIRVEHIKQCPERPELKLIAYCEALRDACRQFVHWYAEDSTEEKRDNAYDAAVAALALPESLAIRAAKQQ